MFRFFCTIKLLSYEDKNAYIIQMRTPFSTINYLVDNFSLNFETLKIKIKI